MITITRKDKKEIGARILNIENFTLAQLKQIVDFWDNHPNYEIKIRY